MKEEKEEQKEEAKEHSQKDIEMVEQPADEEEKEEYDYKPNKKQREARARIWKRFNNMLADTIRTEQEEDWEAADKMFRMYVPEQDSDDWRANLTLPDGFAAIQAQMQETIERKSRPLLKRVQPDDIGAEQFANAIMKYSMDRTNFDFQYFLAKYSAAIRGTAFLMDYYRVDKRKIMDAADVNDDGTIKFKEKEVVDFDDDYTEWVPNEYIYVDPDARSIEDAKDCIYREVLDLNEFKRRYEFRPDFMNVDCVKPASETVNKAFFRMPQDLMGDQVEALHYYNRSFDEYTVLVNNVIVRMGPLPNKHKELPVTPVYHYRNPGYFWGIGIPKVIYSLTEERRSIRNLRLDNQKMQQNKMFLKNSQSGDFDEDEVVTRPFGIIEVETNGLPLNQVMQPLEYSDIKASSFKEEEMLLEDIRRAHGIDDRIQGVQMGGTATEAAILKESSQKRINLITTLAEMETIKRIGKLKWSNLQFFYGVPRIEKTFDRNKDVEKKVYKKINVDGKEFTIVTGDDGKKELKVNEIAGTTTFELNKEMATYMEGDYDIMIDSTSSMVISKPIQQAKIVELLTLMSSNPTWMAQIDPYKSLQRMYELFDEDPRQWLKEAGLKVEDTRMLAEQENEIMAAGNVLGPTPDASEEHTLIHIQYTETAEFQSLPPEIQDMIVNHIMGEHDANPMTGAAADLLKSPAQAGTPGANPDTAQPGGPQGGPAIQNADLTPSTVTGEAPNSSQNQNQQPL